MRVHLAAGVAAGAAEAVAERVRGMVLEAGADDCFVDTRPAGKADVCAAAGTAAAALSESAAVAHRPLRAPSSQVPPACLHHTAAPCAGARLSPTPCAQRCRPPCSPNSQEECAARRMRRWSEALQRRSECDVHHGRMQDAQGTSVLT